MFDPKHDDVIAYPLLRVSDAEFSELAEQRGDFTKELVGYPVIIIHDGRVWPNPPADVEIHAVEGAYSKPFFLVKSVRHEGLG